MATEPKPKRPLISKFSLVGQDMNISSMRDLARAEPETFARRVEDLVEKRDASGERMLSWGKIRNLRGLFEALAPEKVTVQMPLIEGGEVRAVQASAFPIFTGSLTRVGLNDAYEAVPTIGQDLVTETDSNKKITHYAAAHALDAGTTQVEEGRDFPEIGASQETYWVGHKRNGRRLSITAEMIEENDVAGLVDKVNKLGEIAAEIIEEQTLSRVMDIDGSGSSPAEPYALHKDNAGVALYQTDADPLTRLSASGNRITTNILADHTDLSTARKRLASFTNERGKRVAIPVGSMVLLVPDALLETALAILGSEKVSGVVNEKSNWGPNGRFRPTLLSSPKLDDWDTGVWYLGDFRKQFVRKWKLRMEYVTLGNSTESYLRSRLAAQFRLAWDVEVGARDYVYVVQNLPATTAPSA